MRISVVGPAHPYKGGAAQHTTLLASHLAEAGHQVIIESWSAQYPRLLYPGQQTVDQPEVPLFDPTRRNLSWRRPDGWLRQGRRMGRESDLVVFMFHSPVQVPPYLAVLRSLRATATRSVMIANNVTAHESRRTDRLLTQALLRSMDGIVVHNDEVAEEARRLTSRPVRVADLPPHLPGGPGEPLPVVGRDDGRVHGSLLFFGLVRPYKGLDVLLRAMAKADARPRLVVAGEFWQNEHELRDLISELQLTGRVELRPGYVDAADIPALFAGTDALVLPYRKATGSQNSLLAFRHGRPVIATKTGSLADAVHDGVDGIACAPNDVDDLARAIDRFYAPGEAARLRAGVRFTDGGESWSNYVDALLGLCAVGRD